MKICMDTLLISRLKNTGPSNYTYEFLKHLTKIYPSPFYHFIWDSSKSIPDFGKDKKIFYINLYIDRIKKDFSPIEEHIGNNKIDIYHCLNNGFSLPKHKKCHYITTVTNLLPVINKNYVDDKYAFKFNDLFINAMKNTDKIIAVSETLKFQLKEKFKIDDSKIKVIYPGYSDIFSPKSKDEYSKILLENFNINFPFILYSGSIQIRKNLEDTLSVFKKIKNEIKDIKLVFAGNINGKRKDYYLKINELVKIFDLNDSVKFLGNVEYDLMPYLYNGAECIINLSKYEGFSMSTIEAMACNTPVVCNNIPIFKEILDSSGIIVNGKDIDSTSERIINLIENKNYKDFIINSQRERLKLFDWNNSIKNTIRLYESFFN